MSLVNMDVAEPVRYGTCVHVLLAWTRTLCNDIHNVDSTNRRHISRVPRGANPEHLSEEWL
jgi:hypothetical protein